MSCETPGPGDERLNAVPSKLDAEHGGLITSGDLPETARESVEQYFGVVKKFVKQPEIFTKVVGVLMAAYSPLGLTFAIIADAALRRKGCDKTSAEK